MAGRRGQGDWSDTGTFLRKPQAGWLHDDDSLINSSVTYSVKVCLCVAVDSLDALLLRLAVPGLRAGQAVHDDTAVQRSDTSHQVR